MDYVIRLRESICISYKATHSGSALRNYYSCGPVLLCTGQFMVVNGCTCRGNTYLAIYEQTHNTLIQGNERCPDSPSCSFLQYQHNDPSCINVYVREGCYGSGTCSGSVFIQIYTGDPRHTDDDDSNNYLSTFPSASPSLASTIMSNTSAASFLRGNIQQQGQATPYLLQESCGSNDQLPSAGSSIALIAYAIFATCLFSCFCCVFYRKLVKLWRRRCRGGSRGDWGRPRRLSDESDTVDIIVEAICQPSDCAISENQSVAMAELRVPTRDEEDEEEEIDHHIPSHAVHTTIDNDNDNSTTAEQQVQLQPRLKQSNSSSRSVRLQPVASATRIIVAVEVEDDEEEYRV